MVKGSTEECSSYEDNKWQGDHGKSLNQSKEVSTQLGEVYSTFFNYFIDELIRDKTYKRRASFHFNLSFHLGENTLN
jgi:hypothetical protein